jgi:hypothetical protein
VLSSPPSRSQRPCGLRPRVHRRQIVERQFCRHDVYTGNDTTRPFKPIEHIVTTKLSLHNLSPVYMGPKIEIFRANNQWLQAYNLGNTWSSEESGYISRHSRRGRIFSSPGPPNLLSCRPQGLSGRAMELTSHLHLVLKSRMVALYLHSHIRLHGVVLH